MRELSRVERSQTRRGEWIGYAAGSVYRIQRQGRGRNAYWLIYQRTAGRDYRGVGIRERTLEEVNHELGRVDREPDYRAVRCEPGQHAIVAGICEKCGIAVHGGPASLAVGTTRGV